MAGVGQFFALADRAGSVGLAPGFGLSRSHLERGGRANARPRPEERTVGDVAQKLPAVLGCDCACPQRGRARTQARRARSPACLDPTGWARSGKLFLVVGADGAATTRRF